MLISPSNSSSGNRKDENGKESIFSSLQPLIDALLPPRCIQCGRYVQSTGTLCSLCWQEVTFFFPPWCAKCGLPLHPLIRPDDKKERTLCLSCLRYDKPFDIARSVFAYKIHAQNLFLRMKEKDSLHAIPALSLWMARIIQNLFTEDNPFTEYLVRNEHTLIPIVPVPIHAKTLQRRQYYPTARLAQQIAHDLKRPFFFAPDVLERLREDCQRGKSVHERITAVKNMYSVATTSLATLGQRPIAILIDDVMTTGATVSACSHMLRKAGVKYIVVITAARVPTILPRYPKWLS